MRAEIRAMTGEDMPAFADLYNLAEAGDPEFKPRTPEQMRKWAIQAPDRATDCHFAAFEGGCMAVGGGGHFTPAKPGDDLAYFHFYVRPDYLGSDEERAVFERVREALRAKGARRINMRANTTNLPKVAMLERLGFRENDYQRHHMERPPLGVPEPRLPDGFILRNARMPEEMEKLLETNNEAYSTRNFKPATMEEFRGFPYLNDPEFLPGLFLAERASDGRIVGWVGSQVEHVYNSLHGRRRGGSYALVVIPSVRGKGIGRALLQSSIRWIASKGMDVAYLGVNHRNPDAVHLYRSLGYQLVGIWQGYEREL